jgi:3-phosphoshikimate 1-carboxyvinyltransferase
MSITISHPTGILKASVNLPSSKSESNRLLVLQALSAGAVHAANLSEANDTKLMLSALDSKDIAIDVQDAGTAMRFLTAYYCAAGQHKILTGTARMQQRPIGILAAALRDIGFDVRYVKEEGFVPLEIVPVDISILKHEVHIAGHVSSQYISALLLIAHTLPGGLTIYFMSELSSRPYIELTLAMLAKAGIKYKWADKSISIPNQIPDSVTITAGADWSAAGYWYSMAALSVESKISLSKLTMDSHQGDKQIAQWAENFGVNTLESREGISLVKSRFAHSENPVNSDLLFDFTHYPDLAQTTIVLCAAKGLKATFSGLESLRIKEADRVAALQNELLKFGVALEDTGEGNFQLQGTFAMSHQNIQTYNDHRMAMAFAPLALLGQITIEGPEVVAKSYPGFWKEMEKAGFNTRVI